MIDRHTLIPPMRGCRPVAFGSSLASLHVCVQFPSTAYAPAVGYARQLAELDLLAAARLMPIDMATMFARQV